MKSVCIIQARLGSSRLPSKSLADVNGRPIITHVVERAINIPEISRVVVAVPSEDIALKEQVLDSYVDVVTGSERDVLSRIHLAAQLHQADVIMRITGDCPLLDPFACGQVLKTFLADPSVQFVCNDTRVSGWPDGTDVEVFSRDLLTKAQARTGRDDSTDREHVTPWMKRHVRAVVVSRQHDEISKFKLSVDTEKDLWNVRRIWKVRPPIDYSIAETAEAARAAGLI